MRVSYPFGPRILVIAPHPDDDAIGCGGTLARLAAAGASIDVTYVTDGSASHVKSRRYPPDVLRDIRESEARAALLRLGIGRRPQFLRAPDGGLAGLGADARAALAGALARRIDRQRITTVLGPWRRDPHPDHVAVAGLVDNALTRCVRRPALAQYRVWETVRAAPADLPRTGEVRVTDVPLRARELRRKRAAILEHRSQCGLVVDDDPDGFCIDAALLALWLQPVERFYYWPPRRVDGDHDSRA